MFFFFFSSCDTVGWPSLVWPDPDGFRENPSIEYADLELTENIFKILRNGKVTLPFSIFQIFPEHFFYTLDYKIITTNYIFCS